MATATNSRTGQLIGLGVPGDLRFNVMTGIDPLAVNEFAQLGGGDPAINSRNRTGLCAPEMRWFGDAELTPKQDAANAPAFADWISRNQLGVWRLITLMWQDGGIIVAGVVRESTQDDYVTAELSMLSEFGNALRNAVLTQMAVEGDQAVIVAGSFDQIGRPVFVCGSGGRIVACSERAERLLAERRWFTARNGCLLPALSAFEQDFAALLDGPCKRGHVSGSGDNALVLRDAEGGPLLVRVHNFPDVDPLRLTTSVLVMPCIAEDNEARLARLVARLFALTPTEALVLSHLSSGRKPDAIAALIGVKASTVRSHLKSIFLKTGTNSQLDVSALMRNLF